MAKRMTATEKWEDSWFRELKPEHKLFWLYILDKCNYAGIWEIDFKLASYVIGIKLTIKKIEEDFKSKFIEVNNDKWFIPKFISFQYGEEFPKANSAVHQKVIKILNKYKLSTVPPLCRKGGASVA